MTPRSERVRAPARDPTIENRPNASWSLPALRCPPPRRPMVGRAERSIARIPADHRPAASHRAAPPQSAPRASSASRDSRESRAPAPWRPPELQARQRAPVRQTHAMLHLGCGDCAPTAPLPVLGLGLQPIAGPEDPADDDQASARNTTVMPRLTPTSGHAVEAPAKAADQVDDRIEQRDLLPDAAAASRSSRSCRRGR